MQPPGELRRGDSGEPRGQLRALRRVRPIWPDRLRGTADGPSRSDGGRTMDQR